MKNMKVQQTGGEWRTEAACLDNPEVFQNREHLAQAAVICHHCPVKSNCEQEAASLGNYALGTWAGVWRGDYQK